MAARHRYRRGASQRLRPHPLALMAPIAAVVAGVLIAGTVAQAQDVLSLPSTRSTTRLAPDAAQAPAARDLPVSIAPSTGSATPAASANASSSPASASSGSVLTASGRVDPAAYRRMAARLATAAGITYRFGSPASIRTGAQQSSPIWQPPAKRFAGNGTSTDRTYQVAGPQRLGRDDYSSDQGQVGYVPTKGSPAVGVDHIETLAMSQNTFSYAPRPSWTYYGKGHPDPDLLAGSDTVRCLNRIGAAPGRFVAQARAYAHGEATANSLIAFDNGVVAAAGTNTARGAVCAKLPAGLRPSAISVTNGNEFALVTAWNTRTLKSELVVIALGGSQRNGSFWSFDWAASYPGLRNYGRPTFAKVLGTVPLPVAAATSLSAVSDNSFPVQLSGPGGGNAQLGDLTLADENNRQSFIRGTNRGKLASAGYAVVASREEKKVVFVDLQPLFQQMTRAYLGPRAAFDAAISTMGQQAHQFPKKFSALPAGKPRVVKTVVLRRAPASVAGMLSGASTPRAYVGTVDGVLHVFAVGGLTSAKSATAAGVREVGRIKVGANPTGITYVKDRATGDAVRQSLDDTVIVTSRGTRAVQWVRVNGSSGSVVRTLRDTRLLDPVAAEDNNTHGTESYVVTVADYSGAKVASYRYGPVIFRTAGGARFGLGPDGHAAFEFGGSYRPGGRPFSISITNVT
ncbi:hypothetical protein GCM10025783_27990 [Amnibacterium soli]|uniref:Uncharacterized protein n=1 Tax=Amnibacterium soli TaxID=1282736 RepID=A0ABP8ZD42_9MICO